MLKCFIIYYALQLWLCSTNTLSSLFSASGPFVSVFWCLCWRFWYVHIQYKAVRIVHLINNIYMYQFRSDIHNVIVCAVWKILKIISSTWWTIRTALYCICTYQNLQPWQLHAHVACTMMTCLEGWLVTFNAYK
jgi:hypothetical protein